MKQFLKVSIALCLLSIVVSGYHYDDYLPEPVHVPQPQVQVDSGKVPTKYKWNGHHKMVKGHGHRHYDTYVKFSKHFDSNPKVMTAISGMDTSVNTCTRIVCEALNVTKHGFTMRLRTWWDTKVYSAICSWVAHSQC